MATLILNFVGPQSWGNSSHFKRRDAGTEPGKSGVYGLIEAAMGLDRSETYPELEALRFGVRADRPGLLAVDFQTAQSVARAKGRGHKDEILRKFYLDDAYFIVALEGHIETLTAIRNALIAPKRPIHLGRRAFSPLCPIILPDSLQRGTLETVLATYPWCASHLFPWSFKTTGEALRVVIDDPNGYEIRRDARIGSPSLHEFTQRRVRAYLVEPVIVGPQTDAGVPITKVEQTLAPTPAPVISKKASRRKSKPAEPLDAPETLYESRLVFENPAFDPTDMNAIHKLILTALNAKGSRQKIPVLFRLDEYEENTFKLLVRSAQLPDWNRLNQFEVVELASEPFQRPNIAPGGRFKFGIRVNPTKKRSGKKFGLNEPEEQIAWLKKKAVHRGGFHILKISSHIQERLLVKRSGRKIFFTAAVFEGVGEITDPVLFEKCLWYGLAASGKFAGFNMLQILDYPLPLPVE